MSEPSPLTSEYIEGAYTIPAKVLDRLPAGSIEHTRAKELLRQSEAYAHQVLEKAPKDDE